MRRKLWPEAPAKEGALGQMSKKFLVYFIDINLFKKPNKINLQWSQRVILRWYCICFLILYSLLAQKKWNLKNDARLPTLPYMAIILISSPSSIEYISIRLYFLHHFLYEAK